VWRRQELSDTSELPGTASTENAELTAARKRIDALKAEVAITAELRSCSARWCPQ
jgi:hypothetical protein